MSKFLNGTGLAYLWGECRRAFSPKTGSSSLTTYSGGTLGTAAAKGVDATTGGTSGSEDLITSGALFSALIYQSGLNLTDNQKKLARNNTGAASTASYTAKLPVSGWSGSAPYTQTVSVAGLLATDDPLVDLDMSGATTANANVYSEDWQKVGRMTVNAANQLTAYCYSEKPTVDLSVLLKVVR